LNRVLISRKMKNRYEKCNHANACFLKYVKITRNKLRKWIIIER
jgi:hypothetical protein